MKTDHHSRSTFTTVNKEILRMTSFRRLSDAFARKSTRVLSAAFACLVLAAVVAQPAAADEPFFVESFSNRTIDADGNAYAVAGGHPELSSTAFSFPTKVAEPTFPTESPAGTYVQLPPGFIGNPSAAGSCPFSKMPSSQFEENHEGEISACPAGSQVGYVLLEANILRSPFPLFPIKRPLFSLPPERGFPAQFGFKILTTPTVLSVFPQSRTESYGLTVATPNIPSIELVSFTAAFFGSPSVCNQMGSACLAHPETGTNAAPFLSNPVDCSTTEAKWSVIADSAQHAGQIRELGVPDLSDPKWKTASEPATPLTGCDDPLLTEQFDPSIATKLLQSGGPAQADQPTGLELAFNFPQSNDPTDLGTSFEPETPQAPEPKDITVRLPAGLSLSPSSSDGLGACSDQASDPAGDQVHYDTTRPVTCPDSSKIGSAIATTPLLATHDPVTQAINGPEPIPGDVYLLKPHAGDLPVGGGNQEGKFRLLIQLENERFGVNFKLPGIATADPQTGQLTAVFSQNPQLPASHLTVSLKPGPRAPLASPTACGKFDTSSTLVPWSTPGTPDAHPSAGFNVASGPNGTACGARPFAPTFSAGTTPSTAGQSSPLTLRIDREDGEKELGSLDFTLPEGLSAKLAGIPACSDAALATAAARTGAAEQANPTCPASRLGTVRVGAGPGSDPFFATGSAYLAGPYKGAPMSVAVITPAVAGPFDLGAIVTRNALSLDPATAQAHVVSDALPQILDGIPLRLRTVLVELDRPTFTLNPTDCEATAVNATLTSTDGTVATRTSPFQAAGCDKLDFKPGLKLALKGKVSRRAHPSLTATLSPRAGDANIASAQVRLPKAAFLDNDNIGQVCTRPQFSAHQCPAGSIYGKATATTPLLGYPLAGPVYLRANPAHKLPDLVVGFNGPASQPIEIELAGKTDSVKGALRNTFEAVPDVPVSSFQLELFGGKKGLIEMSTGFCSNPKAAVLFTGQNGKVTESAPKVAAKCPKKKKSKKGKGGKHKRAGAHSRR